MAPITAMVRCVMFQDYFQYLSVGYMSCLIAHSLVFEFSTIRFKGGGEPCHKTCEIAVLQRDIQQSSRTLPQDDGVGPKPLDAL